MIEISFGIKQKKDTITINFEGIKQHAIDIYGLQTPSPIPPITLEDGTWFEISKDQIAWLKIKEMSNNENDT